MITFYTKVDRRSRRAMTDFLSEHFRYNTMNSWNQSTSYANNIKIHNLGLDREIEDKLYDIIETDEFWAEAHALFDGFAQKYRYRWQAGINGRSGGYLVLYQGYIKPSGYISYCTACGQQNFTSVNVTGNICMRCHEPARRDYEKPLVQTGTFPVRSTDMDEDFSEFTLSELKNRVRLVQEFDRLTDSLIVLAVQMCGEYTVEDETYYVPKTRKVLVTNAEPREDRV